MSTRTLKTENEPFEVKKQQMEWTRSETLALAQQSCTFCFGLGMRPGRAGASSPCNCVFRAIFRACYERFRVCVSKEKYISRVVLEKNSSNSRKSTWGMKDEEYTADFCLVAKRTLNRSEHRIFRYHYLLGADWKLCCMKLEMERGDFFHTLYRIEQKLGRTFRELKPHALFPVDEYFHGSSRQDQQPSLVEVLTRFEDAHTVNPAEAVTKRRKNVLKFPIRRAA